MDHIIKPRPATHQQRILRGATQRVQKALRSRRRQKGFDLIQLGLVVALIGLMMGAALVGVPRLIENIKTGQQVDDLRSFATQAQGMFAHYRANEITTTALAGAEVYPTDRASPFDKEAPSYISRYSGVVVNISADSGLTETSRAVKVSLTPPSAGACSKIAAQMAPLASKMEVGGQPFEASGLPARVDVGAVATACNDPAGSLVKTADETEDEFKTRKEAVTKTLAIIVKV